MTLSSALKKARTIIANKAKQSETNSNTIIVTNKPYNQPLNGELVVILHSSEEE